MSADARAYYKSWGLWTTQVIPQTFKILKIGEKNENISNLIEFITQIICKTVLN
jgi:hypothetical protein